MEGWLERGAETLVKVASNQEARVTSRYHRYISIDDSFRRVS